MAILPDGTCEIAEIAVPAGSYTVTATYGGDANLTGSSAKVSCPELTVFKDATTTTIAVSPTSVVYGHESAAVFTVTVKTHYGEAVPSGEKVTVHIGTATCTVNSVNGGGTCTIGKTALAVGSYSVSAAYPGDGNLTSSTASAATKLTVSKA